MTNQRAVARTEMIYRCVADAMLATRQWGSHMTRAWLVLAVALLAGCGAKPDKEG